jgi:holin-like protein
VPEALGRLAKGLHDHLGLLFVPAGAGVMANFHNIAADATALLAAVVISTVTTIAVTALIVARRRVGRPVTTAAALQ